MYESFYRLKGTPFRMSADEKFCFAHSHYEKAFACVTNSLEGGRGIILLTGIPGCGKTILCRDVISKLNPNKYVTVNIMLSQLSPEELLRKIALELGIPAEEYDKATLLSSIGDYMAELYRVGNRVIVFLDETHKLIANDFAELRLLSTFLDAQNPVLQIVLIGNQALQEAFFESGIEQLAKKSISTCEIKCMTIEQTRSYIRHRLLCVGWRSDPVIDRAVFSIIYDVTQGVARLINHVMSHLLLFSAFEGKHNISVDDILLVIRMLINEDRLTLNSGETLESIKERYKSKELSQTLSVRQDKTCGDKKVKRKFSQLGGSLPDKSSEFDDLSSVFDSSFLENEIGSENDKTDFSTEVEDIPDTDWLDWDIGDQTPPVSKVKDQSNHSSRSAQRAGYARRVQPHGNDLKRSEGEHQWGGVWWMSENVKGKMRVCSAGSDELPSIKIEGCPDLLGKNSPEWFNHQRRAVDQSGLKMKVLVVAVIISSILLFLLLHRFLSQ